jgi:hypothetical protein
MKLIVGAFIAIVALVPDSQVLYPASAVRSRISLIKLNHEHLAWRLPKIGARRAHESCGLAELYELLVAYLLEPNAKINPPATPRQFG